MHIFIKVSTQLYMTYIQSYVLMIMVIYCTWDLDFDDDWIWAKFILSCEAIAACVKVVDITQCENSMPLLCLHRVVATRLNSLTLSLPCDAGSWVANEGNLDDCILTLVKECCITESRRNVDLGCHCKDKEWPYIQSLACKYNTAQVMHSLKRDKIIRYK